ncbi:MULTISPECIES: AMP-binding protein [Aphanothece]|uniref:AMP-binding protein n=1 Tax=Aphanothece TaxID=1121 RepID=UPI003984B03C
MTPAELERAWRAGRVVPLAAPQETAGLAAALASPAPTSPTATGRATLEVLAADWGPGVVVGSGGSRGGRRWCLQPLAHLEASAAATGRWLVELGLEPAACVHLNPLPLHHVSGLLPWIRARQWGGGHVAIAPEVLRRPQDPADLPVLPGDRAALISLVPTQLARLVAEPAGLAWLQRLAVIWVGGAPLPSWLARRAREAGLRLAPCYGATETAAMVTALAPEAFLAGEEGCGPPLAGVALRLAAEGTALEVCTDRLSPGVLRHGRLAPLPRSADGWWRSGDGARLGAGGLVVLGRLDGAILSGGETVFPEQLEARLRELAVARRWPLQELLLLGVDDPEWGQRLVALVRERSGADGQALRELLRQATAAWPPAERPCRWLGCPSLAPGSMGKWQRAAWQEWLRSLEAGGSPRPSLPRDVHAE